MIKLKVPSGSSNRYHSSLIWYLLVIKIWPLHSLQVVKKAIEPAVEGPKVDKAVVRAQRMEARNISPEEVKVAQEAPARPRAERAKKVDNRALAGLK